MGGAVAFSLLQPQRSDPQNSKMARLGILIFFVAARENSLVSPTSEGKLHRFTRWLQQIAHSHRIIRRIAMISLMSS
jgi:hypothetical protein